ncbi:MAG: hypothetical protein LJU34_05195, partial [Oscillospiraceae bacterium]|nr:hypothetical protein [Oscillospiraceae bacterium]
MITCKKKTLALLLIFGLLLCLASCGTVLDGAEEAVSAVNITSLAETAGVSGNGCLVVMGGVLSEKEEVPFDSYFGVLLPAAETVEAGETWEVQNVQRMLSETPVRVSQFYMGGGTMGASSTPVSAEVVSPADMDEETAEALLGAVADAFGLSLVGYSAELDGVYFVRTMDVNATAFYPAYYQIDLYSAESDTEARLLFPIVNVSGYLDGVYTMEWFSTED